MTDQLEPDEITDWASEADNVGPFAPLPELRRLLKNAPKGAWFTNEWHWLYRIISAREIAEGGPIYEEKSWTNRFRRWLSRRK